jgi:hypothetical protein
VPASPVWCTQPAVPSHRVVIDEHLLLEAIRVVRDAGAPPDPTNVSVALGATAEDGGYWDVTIVAGDLAELESLGKFEHAPRLVATVADATVPTALPVGNGAPQRQDDITAEWARPAADEGSRRSFFQRIARRGVVLPLACVAALLIGFGSVAALLRLGDRPAQSDTKPVPTTAAPVVPPSAAAPAVTTPPASATSGPTVENEPAPPAPPTEASVAPAPPPNQNPAGHAPPGRNK